MEIKKNNIYNMDCNKGLKLMKDNSVEITITSPPYNIDKDKYQVTSDNMSNNEYYKFIKTNILDCIRVSKHYVFYNFQLLERNKLVYLQLLGELKEYIKEIIIWHKSTSAPVTNENQLNSSFEFVVVFCKPEEAKTRTFKYAYFTKYATENKNILYNQIYLKKIYDTLIKEMNNKGFNISSLSDIINEDHINNNIIYGKNSATEKFTGRDKNRAIFPEYFVKWILDRFTKQNDTILDVFMGLGTTAYVCKNNSRNYIGFETDKMYIDN